MAIARCSECQIHFELPFDDKELSIWVEVCKDYGDWLCIECADLELLKSEYLSIESVD